MTRKDRESYNKLETAFRELLDAYMDNIPEELQTTSNENRWLEKAGIEKQKLAEGGTTTPDDTLEDIAWDIGLEKGWIKDSKWNSDKEKGKAMALAYKEANQYKKGGEAKGGNGISFIITGSQI